jgi:hypothetical protein
MSEIHDLDARRPDPGLQDRRPVGLPLTVEGLLALRTSARVRTLNDYVDDIHLALWSSEDYRRTLDAVYDEDAIEGSLACDNNVAANLIRDYARAHAIVPVAGKKVATIIKALNVVLRRYHISRRERAMTVGGLFVNEQSAAE